jgi:hypothetical protein
MVRVKRLACMKQSNRSMLGVQMGRHLTDHHAEQ